MSEWPFSQAHRPVVVAHRGASAERPENTLAAFARAADLGADAVEFDVRVTADGRGVVLHDDTLDRTTDGEGPLAERTLAEVRGLRAGGEPVPTVEEALAALSGRCAAVIEIKHQPGGGERAVDEACRALAEVAFEGPAMLISFDPLSLAHARRAAPDRVTGLLTSYEVGLPDAADAAATAGHGFVLPFALRVLAGGAGPVADAHDRGLRVGTWVTDDPADATALAGLGVDAIATNDPAAILAALGPG